MCVRRTHGHTKHARRPRGPGTTLRPPATVVHREAPWGPQFTHALWPEACRVGTALLAPMRCVGMVSRDPELYHDFDVLKKCP